MDSGVLRSWKEIAARFGVSTRTVQSWEVEMGLPVHRTPGAKGRVYAYEAELDRWLRDHESSMSPAAERLEASRRPILVASCAFAVLLVAGGVLLFRHFRSAGDSPIGVRVENDFLIALGAKEGELWRYKLEASHSPAADHANSGPDHLIADLNGDGAPEVVFAPCYPFTDAHTSRVLCFSSRGKLLWQYELGKSVRTVSGDEYRPPFRAMSIGLVHLGPGRGLGIVAVAVNTYFPCQVVLLAPDGRLLREYWHAGHIQRLAVADLNRDGVDEIYLGGISNSAHRATLVVLDPQRMGGADREADAKYQLAVAQSPVEEARILFARIPELTGVIHWNGVGLVVAEDSHLRVHVNELPAREDAQIVVIYQFTPDLRLESVDLSDNYENNVRLLSGKPAAPRSVALSRLRDGLTFVTPRVSGPLAQR